MEGNGMIGIVGCCCIIASRLCNHPDGIYRPDGVNLMDLK